VSTEIFLSGNEETLKPVITLLIALNQLIDSKDIGQFVGEPIEDNVKALPHALRMKLFWYSKKSPPYIASMGTKLVKAEYQIPDVDRKIVDWATIKTAMGGNDGYMWGRFVATVNLDNGRQMQCYGATAKEADNQLEKLLTLTTAKPLTFGVTELKKEGRRAKGESMEIESTRVYPAYMVLINSKRITKLARKAFIEEEKTKVRSKLRGDYLERGTERIKMWTEKRPDNFIAVRDGALRFDEGD
jgi:hypothetical protein